MDRTESVYVVEVLCQLLNGGTVSMSEFEKLYGSFGSQQLQNHHDELCTRWNIPNNCK